MAKLYEILPPEAQQQFRPEGMTPKGRKLLDVEIPDTMSPAREAEIMRVVTQNLPRFTLAARNARRVKKLEEQEAAQPGYGRAGSTPGTPKPVVAAAPATGREKQVAALGKLGIKADPTGMNQQDANQLIEGLVSALGGQTRTGIGGTVQSLGEAVGLEGVAKAGKSLSDAGQAFSERHAPLVGDVRQVKTFDAAGKFLGYGVGQAAGSSGPTMAASMVGGAVAGKPGAITAGALMGYALNTGDVRQELDEVAQSLTPQQRGAVALALSVPLTALDSATEIMTALKLTKAAPTKELRKGFIKTVLKELAKAGLMEAGTEAAQESGQYVGTRAAGGTPIDPVEAGMRGVNAAIPALITGGIMGGGSEAISEGVHREHLKHQAEAQHARAQAGRAAVASSPTGAAASNPNNVTTDAPQRMTFPTVNKPFEAPQASQADPQATPAPEAAQSPTPATPALSDRGRFNTSKAVDKEFSGQPGNVIKAIREQVESDIEAAEVPAIGWTVGEVRKYVRENKAGILQRATDKAHRGRAEAEIRDAARPPQTRDREAIARGDKLTQATQKAMRGKDVKFTLEGGEVVEGKVANVFVYPHAGDAVRVIVKGAGLPRVLRYKSLQDMRRAMGGEAVPQAPVSQGTAPTGPPQTTEAPAEVVPANVKPTKAPKPAPAEPVAPGPVAPAVVSEESTAEEPAPESKPGAEPSTPKRDESVTPEVAPETKADEPWDWDEEAAPDIQRVPSQPGKAAPSDPNKPAMASDIDNPAGASQREVEGVKKMVEGKTLHEAATLIASGSKKEYTKHIAQVVADKLASLEKEHGKPGRIAYGNPGNAIAAYSFAGEVKSGDHSIIMGNKAGVGALLHELVHAATIYVTRFRNNTPDVAKALEDLSLLRHAIISQSEASDEHYVRYLTANDDELLAVGLTDPKAQAFLEGITFKRQSAWGKLVNIIRRILGVSEDAETALSELLRISDVLLAPGGQGTEAPKKIGGPNAKRTKTSGTTADDEDTETTESGDSEADAPRGVAADGSVEEEEVQSVENRRKEAFARTRRATTKWGEDIAPGDQVQDKNGREGTIVEAGTIDAETGHFTGRIQWEDEEDGKTRGISFDKVRRVDEYPPKMFGENFQMLSYGVMPALRQQYAVGAKLLEALHTKLDEAFKNHNVKIRFFEHQIETAGRIQQAWKRGDGYLVGDGAGTGKTMGALLAIARAFDEGDKAVVLVAPNETILDQWRDWAEALGMTLETVNTTDVARPKSGRIIATTYAALQDRKNGIGFDPDVVVLDEAHQVAGYNPNRADQTTAPAAMRLLKQSKKRLFLSATPMKSVMNYHLYAPFMLGAFDGWNGMSNELGIQVNGGSVAGVTARRLEALHKRLVAAGVYSKSDMRFDNFKNANGKHIRMHVGTIKSAITPVLVFKYNSTATVVAGLIKDIEDGSFIPTKSDGTPMKVGNAVMGLNAQLVAIKRGILEESRIEHAVHLALRKHAEGFKLVFFLDRLTGGEYEGKKTDSPVMRELYDRLGRTGIKFSSPVQQVKGKLKAQGLSYAEITGEVPAGGSKRAKGITAFQAGNLDAAVVTVAAGGTGVSLHDLIGNGPRYGIMLQLPFTADKAIQAFGRLFRGGSQSNAMLHILSSNSATDRHYAERLMARLVGLGCITSGNEKVAETKHIPFVLNYDDEAEGAMGLSEAEGDSEEDVTTKLDAVKWADDRPLAAAAPEETEPENIAPEPAKQENADAELAEWEAKFPYNTQVTVPNRGTGNKERRAGVILGFFRDVDNIIKAQVHIKMEKTGVQEIHAADRIYKRGESLKKQAAANKINTTRDAADRVVAKTFRDGTAAQGLAGLVVLNGKAHAAVAASYEASNNATDQNERNKLQAKFRRDEAAARAADLAMEQAAKEHGVPLVLLHSISRSVNMFGAYLEVDKSKLGDVALVRAWTGAFDEAAKKHGAALEVFAPSLASRISDLTVGSPAEVSPASDILAAYGPGEHPPDSVFSVVVGAHRAISQIEAIADGPFGDESDKKMLADLRAVLADGFKTPADVEAAAELIESILPYSPADDIPIGVKPVVPEGFDPSERGGVKLDLLLAPFAWIKHLRGIPARMAAFNRAVPRAQRTVRRLDARGNVVDSHTFSVWEPDRYSESAFTRLMVHLMARGNGVIGLATGDLVLTPESWVEHKATDALENQLVVRMQYEWTRIMGDDAKRMVPGSALAKIATRTAEGDMAASRSHPRAKVLAKKLQVFYRIMRTLADRELVRAGFPAMSTTIGEGYVGPHIIMGRINDTIEPVVRQFLGEHASNKDVAEATNRFLLERKGAPEYVEDAAYQAAQYIRYMARYLSRKAFLSRLAAEVESMRGNDTRRAGAIVNWVKSTMMRERSGLTQWVDGAMSAITFASRPPDVTETSLRDIGDKVGMTPEQLKKQYKADRAFYVPAEAGHPLVLPDYVRVSGLPSGHTRGPASGAHVLGRDQYGNLLVVVSGNQHLFAEDSHFVVRPQVAALVKLGIKATTAAGHVAEKVFSKIPGHKAGDFSNPWFTRDEIERQNFAVWRRDIVRSRGTLADGFFRAMGDSVSRAVLGWNVRAVLANFGQLVLTAYPEMGFAAFSGVARGKLEAEYMGTLQGEHERLAELSEEQGVWKWLSGFAGPMAGYKVAEDFTRGAAIVGAEVVAKRMGARAPVKVDDGPMTRKHLLQWREKIEAGRKMGSAERQAHFIEAGAMFNYTALGKLPIFAGAMGKLFGRLMTFPVQFLYGSRTGGYATRPIGATAKVGGAIARGVVDALLGGRLGPATPRAHGGTIPGIGSPVQGHGKRGTDYVVRGSYPAPRGGFAKFLERNGARWHDRHGAMVGLRAMMAVGAIGGLTNGLSINFFLIGTPGYELFLLLALRGLFPDNEFLQRMFESSMKSAIASPERGAQVGTPLLVNLMMSGFNDGGRDFKKAGDLAEKGDWAGAGAHAFAGFLRVSHEMMLLGIPGTVAMRRGLQNVPMDSEARKRFKWLFHVLNAKSYQENPNALETIKSGAGLVPEHEAAKRRRKVDEARSRSRRRRSRRTALLDALTPQRREALA